MVTEIMGNKLNLNNMQELNKKIKVKNTILL